MKFKYIGKTDEDYTNGTCYYYVDCGIHWDTKDSVIWITYNDSPCKDDIDYACAFSLNEFIESFEI